MKKNYPLIISFFHIRNILFLAFLISFSFGYSQSINPWLKASKNDKNNVLKAQNQISNDFKVYTLDISILKKALTNSPKRSSYHQKSSKVIEFPNAEGKFERFSIFEASIMDPELQAKYPDIRSYAGKGIDDPSATIRFSISQLGLKTMKIAAGKNAVFIEPYTNDFSQYMVYDKQSKDASLDSFECLVKVDVSNKIKSAKSTAIMPYSDGRTLKTFRLAMSATGDYTQYFGGTVANALAAINATMTRVNGIFEIDFGITMELIANNDVIIYTDPNNDPFTSNLNSELQSNLTAVIGEANYDIGHLLNNARNKGDAGCIGCVCVDNKKGRAYTSHTSPEGDNFDVDYVAHEMGHQFGGNHTWTYSGNEGSNTQMEPGSGSTIMGYAGITGATDVQAHSNAYFHAISIEQITNYIKTTSCQTNTLTGNNVPTALAGSDFIIPKSTPFVLTGEGTDADGDNLSFCWEQMDENNASTTYPNISAETGIAFRSFSPSSLKTRSFPSLSTVLTGNTYTTWEAIPAVSRILNFRLTVRDNVAGNGASNSDDMVVNVNDSAGPFVVLSPNLEVTWTVGHIQTVTWDVAGTDNESVNCQTVNILLSINNGDTFPISLASGVANNGSAQITVPNYIGTQNRIKIEAADNIFYDISNTNFLIENEVTCNQIVPTGLALSNTSSIGTTITWNNVTGATYLVEFRESGTSTWISQSTIENKISITDLNSSTNYEVRIKSVCSSTTSNFCTPIIFTTLNQTFIYCSSKGNSAADEYISRVQFGEIDNSSEGINGYSDYTTISTGLNKGQAVTITITPTWTDNIYNEGYGVWIDFNKDGDFEDSGEQVWTKTASKTTPVSGTFTIPESALSGSTTMRVSMKYNGTPTSCETFRFGEVEDYSVSLITSEKDSQAPKAPTLTVNNETETTIDLSWKSSADSIKVTSYDIYKDDFLLTSVTGNLYQVTGLTADTSYKFTIRAKDASGNISNYSNIATITTLKNQITSKTILHQGYFEYGWDGWTDGGSNVARYSGSRSHEGNYSIQISDNSGTSSSMTLSDINVSLYNFIEIEFYFYAFRVENGEDFWFRYFDGTNWATVTTYTQGIDFNNNSFYTATVTLDKNNFEFPSNAQFSFQCNASGDFNNIYIDQVTITGITGVGTSKHNDGLEYLKSLDEDAEYKLENEINDFVIYPNPVNGNNLNIKMNAYNNSTFKISNVIGQILNSGKVNGEINISNLKAGVYIIEVNDGEKIMSKKFVKQ